jgi:glycosyltransferase involved in cell wall biosynthesis
MSSPLSVSLVIPVFNESKTISRLIASIALQTCQPNEIILVDGGSTDDTVALIKELTTNDPRYRCIEAGRAMPGKARNIGASAAANPWLVFTDAGIRLEPNWLESLVKKAMADPSVSIVYGNFSPEINNFFEKCAMISYVPPLRPGAIRTKSIVTCLLKKEVWKKAGGFPDFRASEDLIFMENAEKAGYSFAYAPEAMVYWQLRPDLASTFKKFDLYSMHNVWAGRQAYWHYGVARQYIILLCFILIAIFIHWAWILLLPAWMGARAVKRILLHRYELGIKTVFNPAVITTVAFINFIIDMATFSGWIKAVMKGNNLADRISNA